MQSGLETLEATIGFGTKFGIFYILGLTHETYCSSISKRKSTCPGVDRKAQLAILDLCTLLFWCSLRHGKMVHKKDDDLLHPFSKIS